MKTEYRNALRDIQKYQLILNRMKKNRENILKKLEDAKKRAEQASSKLNDKQKKTAEKPFKARKLKIKGVRSIKPIGKITLPTIPAMPKIKTTAAEIEDIINEKESSLLSGGVDYIVNKNSWLSALFKDVQSYYMRELSNSELDLYLNGYEYARDEYFTANGFYSAKRDMAILRLKDLIREGRASVNESVRFWNSTPDVREHKKLEIGMTDLMFLI